MQKISRFLCGGLAVWCLLGCQANRPPPRQAEQEPAPAAMTAEQMEQVQEVLQRGSGTLNVRCYQPELDRRGEKFEARAVIKILIGVAEKAQSIEFGEATMDAAFRQCVSDVIRQWEFPRLPQAQWFTYPVSFSPAY